MERAHQTAFLLFGMAFLADGAARFGVVLLGLIVLGGQIVDDARKAKESAQ